MKRLTTILTLAIGQWLVHGSVLAQQTPGPDGEIPPNLNWVFLLSIVVLLGFLAFMAFVALYYVLAVIARNRKFATATVAAAGPTTAPIAQPAPAPVPAAAAPAAAVAAPTASAPAAAAPAPAPAAAPTTAQPSTAQPSTGGVPRIDPNNLPDGIDAVTRGRLKKLAVLQERGQEPPAELLKELEGVLGQVSPAAAAEVPAAPAEAAPAEAEAAPAEAAPAAPAADLGGLPHIDPNNLPDGIDAVAKGRLKKLAVFQERGQAPPADLVEKLKPILDQMG